jgi:hypothetical protein
MPAITAQHSVSVSDVLQVLMIKYHPHSLQLKWWNFVFTTLVEAKCNDEELVLSKVNPFLALDDVRHWICSGSG